MQITLITLIILFWVSSFQASKGVNEYFSKRKTKDEIEINDIIKTLIFLSLTISIIIYLFTFEFLLGMMAILICAISICIHLLLDTTDFGVALLISILVIICTLALLFVPCIVSKNEDVSEETVLLSEYEKDSEKVVIIKLSNKIYSIMEYDGSVELPFTIQNFENYEIFENKGKEKIVVINKDVRRDSLASYFKISKPEIDHSTSYKVYLNKDNVKYN